MQDNPRQMEQRTATEIGLDGLRLCDDFGDGEPRVRDVEVGRRLGMARPEDIRQQISKYADDLAELGDLTSSPLHDGTGCPSREYWLNMEQALFVVGRSETQLGRALLKEFIRVAGLSKPRPRAWQGRVECRAGLSR